MAATLSTLPEELVEMINVHLDVKDICSLRSTCRELAIKASNGIFKTIVSTGRLRLTEDGIEAFQRVATAKSLGPHMKELTIIGIAHNSGDSVPLEKVRSLSKAFGYLKTALAPGQFQKMSLEVAALIDGDLSAPEFPAKTIMTLARSARPETPVRIEEPPSLRQVYTAAATSFKMVTLALHASQLPLGTLEVFTTQIGCSVPCDAFASVLAETKNRLLSRVRRLCIRLCHSLPPREEDASKKPQLRRSERKSTQHLADAAQFLNTFTALDSLELRFFHIGVRTLPALFSPIAQVCAFSDLRNLTLNGIGADEKDVNTFFGAHLNTLEHVTMVEVKLRGTYKHVFNAITQKHTKVRSIRLINLWQQGKSVIFKERPYNTYSLERVDAETKKKIDYKAETWQPLGDLDHILYMGRIPQEYGPPQRSLD